MTKQNILRSILVQKIAYTSIYDSIMSPKYLSHKMRTVSERNIDIGYISIYIAISFGSCQARWGLPVGFLLLRYSVLCTVESLSLLYLPFIS